MGSYIEKNGRDAGQHKKKNVLFLEYTRFSN
jgi:hypothetical protein